jgi:peroxiredoxin (alkyl hydroperoxide reductase subunit C)
VQGRKQPVVLLFATVGFTPVCTTEFMIFARMMNDFRTRNTELVGLSIGSVYSHITWIRKIKELSWKDMKHVEVSFPVIADLSMEVARMYGMLHPCNCDHQTVRAVFIIDPQTTIRTILYYPPKTGRNIEEIKRILLALQKTDCEDIATPANWIPDADVVLPAPRTCGEAKERTETIHENGYCLDWFLSFQQSD